MYEILRYICYVIMAIICDCGNGLNPAGSHYTVQHHVLFIKYLDVVNKILVLLYLHIEYISLYDLGIQCSEN